MNATQAPVRAIVIYSSPYASSPPLGIILRAFSIAGSGSTKPLDRDTASPHADRTLQERQVHAGEQRLYGTGGHQREARIQSLLRQAHRGDQRRESQIRTAASPGPLG